MFTVKIKDKTLVDRLFTVAFSYEFLPILTWMPEDRQIVTVTIYDGLQKDNKKISVASAICNPVDMFNKNTGRKIALTNALKLFTNDRSIRKEFWIAYVNTISAKNKWRIE